MTDNSVETLGDQTANRIWSKASVETIETYDQRIEIYRDKNFTYIPLPKSDQYYNQEEDELREIEENQYISADFHLFEVLNRLDNEPFLIHDTRRTSSYKIEGINYPYGSIIGDKELIEKAEKNNPRWPDEKIEEEERYRIITPADLNKRPVKEMIYPCLAELADLLKNQIEEFRPEATEILGPVGDRTVGRWYYSQRAGLGLHVSEFMTLTDFKRVLSSDSELRDRFGFSSRTEMNDKLDKVSSLRNRVMHANRSLINSREDIPEVVSQIELTQDLIKQIKSSD